MDEPRIKASEKALDRMLLTLASGGFVTLDPPPPATGGRGRGSAGLCPQSPLEMPPDYAVLAPRHADAGNRCSSSAAFIRSTASS